MLAALQLRDRVTQRFRKSLEHRGFMEVETPILGKSTPEGARDFVVPSRLNPGKFYALPQSPQLFKQLLMVGGVERYYQIARCFRDEDLRADRQPEFTQVDIEMSFATQDDIMAMMEDVMHEVMHEAGVDLVTPLQRITWHDAMERFGSDRPDLRFGTGAGRRVAGLLGERVQGVRGCAVDRWCDQGAQRQGRRGLEPRQDRRAQPDRDRRGRQGAGVGRVHDATARSRALSRSSSLTTRWRRSRSRRQAEPGDLVCMVADARDVANEVLGVVRLKLADELGIERKGFATLWVVDFPMFTYDAEEESWKANHHPFTLPVSGAHRPDRDRPGRRPDSQLRPGHERARDRRRHAAHPRRGRCRRASCSVSAHSEEAAREQFGFLLDALAFGAPPHGGIALGLDRLIMVLAGAAVRSATSSRSPRRPRAATR